jgi:hypothetical protein
VYSRRKKLTFSLEKSAMSTEKTATAPQPTADELEERQLANEEESRIQAMADSLRSLIENSGADAETVLGGLAHLFWGGFPGCDIDPKQENQIVTLLEAAIRDQQEDNLKKL